MVAIRYDSCNSEPQVCAWVANCYDRPMDVHAYRAAHLTAAIAQAGSITELAERAGLNDKYLRQIKSGYQGTKDKQPRRLGDEAARKIELALGWSAGQMDQPTPVDALAATLPATIGPPRLRIPRLDIEGSMGNGRERPNHDNVVEVVEVNPVQLRTHLGHTPVSSTSALRLISAYGDSMAPTFADGDVLLVDTGVHEIRLDAVFVLSYRDELFIKRLQRRPEGVLRMLSDNKVYDPIDITEEDRSTFRVLGRVLLAWNARKL